MITLSNDILELKILKRGVTFTSFKHLKDNLNIITAYQNIEDYEDNSGPYLGALVGPLAGRTEPNQYGLDLDINNPPNHLHGGTNGLSFTDFDAEVKDNKAIFKTHHNHVAYEITVSLDENKVILDMKATPDVEKDAVLNLTNHMYFNLQGTNDLNEHQIKLEADKVSYLNEKMLNTYNLQDVTDTVFDLREYQDLSVLLNKTHPQFDISRHIDHSFYANKVKLKADTKELTVEAKAPFMHLYFANYFDENFIDEHGRKAKNHASIAIEPQYLPNDLDMKVYTSDNPYHETITYTLDI